MCMRTNIVLDDDLIREAMRYSHARTRRSLIEEALKIFIVTKSAEQRLLSYRQRTDLLEQKLTGLSLRESPNKIIRSDRDRL